MGTFRHHRHQKLKAVGGTYRVSVTDYCSTRSLPGALSTSQKTYTNKPTTSSCFISAH